VPDVNGVKRAAEYPESCHLLKQGATTAGRSAVFAVRVAMICDDAAL